MPTSLFIALAIAQTSAPPADYVAKPVYEHEPNSADYRRTFPDRAYREGVKLRGGLDCLVTADGRLEACTVKTTGPEGYGFEAAALELSKAFKLAPKDADGAPVAGRRFKYWFHYEPPGLSPSDDPDFLQVSACAGLALARAEAAPYTAASRNATIGWTILFQDWALHVGLSPSDSNQRLEQLRQRAADQIAAGLVTTEQDERCWKLLTDSPGH